MTALNEATQQKVTWLTIDENSQGQRIDNFLIRTLRGVPKSRVYRLLRKGEVRVNKARVKPEYKLELGDTVRIPPVRVAEPPVIAMPSQSLWRHLEQAIVYESDRLMVVNKPSGVAVHGGDGVNLGLIEALRQIRSDCHYLELVHRLDKETSGCVIIAKKRSCLRQLQARFRSKTGLIKQYLALVVGKWPEQSVRVREPLLRLEAADGNRIVKVHADGKPSETLFSVLEYLDWPGVGPATLVSAQPITGRTHQIRVHAQFMGHPLIGDPKYGLDAINRAASQLGPVRLMLHAESISFTADDNLEALSVAAPIAEDMAELLAKLREGSK